MDWTKNGVRFCDFRGAAVVQLLGMSIEKPRQARAIPKKHGRNVRFRKTTAGTCDSEKPRQARAITAGACDSKKTRLARQGAPGNPMVGKMPKSFVFKQTYKANGLEKNGVRFCDF